MNLCRLGMFVSGNVASFVSQDLFDDFWVLVDGSVRFWPFDQYFGTGCGYITRICFFNPS